ncbi:MAG: alpha-amylase family glycosyl hydrolase [Agathobacter sp.]|nr:alpha-amylase family glycosyl hydrolase [Agathobacter sp.]
MGERKREPIRKRLLSLLMAFAMVLTSLAVTPVTAKAADSVKLYFELPEGTSVTDWCVNVWAPAESSVLVTEGDSENAFRPSSWGAGSIFPTLLADTNLSGWGYVKVSGTVDGLQFVNKDGSKEFKCWNAQITKNGCTEAYFSSSDGKWYTTAEKTTEIKEPEIQNIFVLAGEAGLAGSNWNHKDMKNQLKQDSTDPNKFSITYQNVQAGTYEYKILQDPENKGWDLPWGSGSGSGGNRKVTVDAPSDVTFAIDLNDPNKNVVDQGVNVTKKLCQTFVINNPANIVKGKATELTTSAEYYDGSSATPSTVAVSYALKGSPEDVTLTGNSITVAKTSTRTGVTVIASYGDFKQDITIPVVDKQYTVTINMYSQDLEMKPGVSDVYIFENGGNRNTVVKLDTTVVDEQNGVTWVQGTTTVPYNSLGIIARDVAGSWDGGQDKPNRYYVIDEELEEVTLWYEYGKTPTTEKPTITKAEPRYFYLEYENPTLAAGVTPQFYSWTTGYAAKRIDFEANGTGKWIVKVPVKPTCAKVDFVVVLDATGDPWVKDGGDHSISFPLDQTVVCASIKTGEEPKLSAPYNIGYELQPKKDQISFYYRDDKALIEGKLAELQVAVEINGTEQPMTYSESNKRFEYVSKGLQDGRIDYRYKVGSEYVLDKYNPNKEVKNEVTYSYVDYYKLNATISAEVMNPSFNYNENNVVKFKVNQAKTDKQKLDVASASIDVSSLGGSSALAIQPELQAVTISVTQDTALGTKTLPIVVTDQYGNEYHTTVDVNVVARTKTSADDFDWDEAVIYFMVTDRFFDGNETNNTASGANTYGQNPGLYHGGDFAGLTQKLDYLDELGINTVWITPIVENIPGVKVTGTGSADVPYNAAFHGYWASDFTKLNPTLGTEEEFRTLISEAHKRGIKIMVDIVVNHAGYGTEADFNKVLDGKDMIRSGSDIVSGDDQKDSLSNLPDFKTEDPAVSAQLVKWQTQWVKDYGIDYFRVDTVKHVENATWAELKNSLTEVDPEFKMIGEYAGGGYAGNGGTLGTGQMDSDLDFDFNDQATSFVSGNISSVESFLASRNAALNNTYMTGQFLGSHDEDGFKQNLISNKKMSEEAATAASLVAATLQITAKGQPVIYYGEEIGLTGLNNYPYQTNRYDFDWSLVNENNVTYIHYKKMLAIRNKYTDVFARGNRKTVAVSDEKGYDVVSRSYGGTTLYVGMNIKSQAQTVTIPVSANSGTIMTDLYSGKVYTVSNGTVKVTIPSAAEGGTVILKKGSASSGGGSTTPTKPDTPSKPADTNVTTNPDGTKTEVKTEIVKNESGKEVTVTTTVEKDAQGNVTGSKEVSVIAEVSKNTSATVTVQKDATGKVTSATAELTTTGKGGKKSVTGTISGAVVGQISDAAGTKDVEISVTVTDGKKSYTVKADAEDLTAGTKLKVVAIDPKTQKYVLVNAKTYKVGKNGDVKVSLPGGETYQLMDTKEAAAVEKEIYRTITVKASSATVKKGKSTKVEMSSKLDMDNVSKITYTSSKKSVATVSKTGKITTKKAGTVTVKAKVTLKNGKTKTVSMKIKVK